MRIQIFSLLAFIALTARAFAQTEPEPHAAPGSLAIGMLESAGALDIFEVLPSENIRIRHTASGLVCEFGREGHGRVLVFPGLPHGDDVGCDRPDGRTSLTLYATRYPKTPSLDAALAQAIDEMRTRFGQARMTAPPISAQTEITPPDAQLPEGRSARFNIARPGLPPLYSRASVALIDGWVILMRYSAAITDPAQWDEAEIASSLEWSLALRTIVTYDAP